MSTVGRNTAPPLESWACVTVRLGRLLERRMQQALAEHGITVAQFMALSHIRCRPGVNRADLARELQVSPQAVGALVTQLVEVGFVTLTSGCRADRSRSL